MTSAPEPPSLPSGSRTVADRAGELAAAAAAAAAVSGRLPSAAGTEKLGQELCSGAGTPCPVQDTKQGRL